MGKGSRRAPARRRGLVWKIIGAGLAGYFVLGLFAVTLDQLLPGRALREAERLQARQDEAAERQARQAARAVERRIREAAREARQLDREARAAADQAEQARRDAIRQAVCRRSPSCWADHHLADAHYACRASLESLARYRSRWTTRPGERRFTRVVSVAEGGHGVIIYAGDRIELQNGFGAWQPHTYACAYDPERGTGLALSMQAGRL